MSKVEFFGKMDALGLALSFDDVRLQSGYAEVLPDHVETSTLFSRRIGLKIPIVSAAMDTVTEAPMAIALAKLGGLGIIHRGLSVKDQAKAVAHVKMHMSAMVNPPISVRPTDTIRSILAMKDERDYQFHSFLVTNEGGKLLGMVTRHHFDMAEDKDGPVAEVMTRELVTAPIGTTMEEARQLMLKHNVKHLPLVDQSENLVSLYVFSDIKRVMSGDANTHNVDSKGQLIVGAAIGTGEASLERAEALVARGVDVLVIDTAHGDSKPVYEILRQLKAVYGDRVDVVAGNISQPTSARRLADAGADGIKVGQGPGSICTTRIIAGIGQPQLTAVYECVTAIIGLGIPICADGGIRYSGDITIAIGAGAHSVMLGSLLAGTDETPGDIKPGLFKSYRGMGSLAAMKENSSSRERYLQENRSDVSKLVPEGVEARVPYRGAVAKVIYDLVGGLRQGMGYVGAATIEELREKGDFKRLSSAGLAESHPHDITITADTPNYRRS